MHLHLAFLQNDIPITPGTLIRWTNYLWLLLCAVWLGFAPLAKPAVYRQPLRERLLHILPMVIGAWLLFGPPTVPDPIGWINHPVFTANLATRLGGFLAVLCGIAFSIWARLALDG